MVVKEQEGLRRLREAEDEMEELRKQLDDEEKKELKRKGELEVIEEQFKDTKV